MSPLDSLVGIHELQQYGIATGDIGLHARQERWHLECREELIEEALFGSPENAPSSSILFAARARGICKRGVDIFYDDLPCTGDGVVAINLFWRQGMDDLVVFNPRIRDGAGEIEPQGLEITGDQLHIAHAGGGYLRNKVLCIRESTMRPPDSQARGIRKVADLCGCRGRGIDDARIGEGLIKVKPGLGLLRGYFGPAQPFLWDGVLEIVAFIGNNDAIKIFPKPFNHLLYASPLWRLLAPQGGIGHIENACPLFDRAIALLHKDIISCAARKEQCPVTLNFGQK